MTKIVKNSICLVVIVLASFNVFGQFNGTNLVEYQFGEAPNDVNAISSIYDRFVANFNYKSFRSDVTLEQFYSEYDGSNYTNISQFSVQYNSDKIQVKLGNFYETIGRGTLLHSFQIPGAILEDLSYRSRHYFNRDILGASVKFQSNNFMTKVLYGSPLNYVFPPNQNSNLRRSDTIAALYSEYTYKNQTLGAAIMHHSNSGNEKLFSMITLSGSISPKISYYTEVSKNIKNNSINDFSDAASYAIYSGVNISLNNIGISAEYKNYNNFLIGSGINEPPALVKEHTYRLLNRSTHVPQPLNESGYQLEAFYTMPNLSVLTLNHTKAINKFGQKFTFNEYFLEYDFMLKDKHDIKLFIDYAEDPFKLEENRISTGLYSEWKAGKNSTIRTDYEFQHFDRLNEGNVNQVLSVGYAYKSKIIGSIVAEHSTDNYLVNSGSKYWLGANLKYKLNNKHSFQLFAGERRGGPACNAGVCYEVLDFKGVELRVTSRF
ncbi:DUF6029 family protein [uncultured Lutibacter sp.]|uniref:DUF6029 family protein n=1 Tax=uncultured Lutibacter sp. TaxID=437739 RepID=UPI0026115FFC|nr:DUF6029 family protein [uncultured Lutibacter sp.]